MTAFLHERQPCAASRRYSTSSVFMKRPLRKHRSGRAGRAYGAPRVAIDTLEHFQEKWSLDLQATGLPILMQVPAEKALPYAAVVAGCALIIAVGIGLIEAPLFSAPG
jgi:hypothetical protein